MNLSYYKQELFIWRYLGRNIKRFCRDHDISYPVVNRYLNNQWSDDYREFKKIIDQTLRIPPEIGG